MNYKKAQNEYADLRTYTHPLTDPDNEAGDKEAEEQTDLQSDDPESRETGSSAEESSGPKDKKGGNKKIRYKAPITVDHEALEKMNPDYVGWLYIEDTDISYPVMQGPDDDYYLHRTFEGNYLYAGSLFMNSSADRNFSDPCTFVYGHNMKDTSMFGRLSLFTDHGLYTRDSVFWILTKQADYCYRIFSIHVCNEDSDTYTLFSGPSEQVSEYISKMISLSAVDAPDIEYDDKARIVTLSTCLDAEGPERYVVQGIRIN